jgi:hypothetical protein
MALVMGLRPGLGLGLGTTGVAHAGPGVPLGHGKASSLDGHYLSIGPVAGATTLDDTWTSVVGAELSWVLVREGRIPAGLGVALGAVSFAGEPGGQAWFELEAGLDRLGPLKLGLGLGPVMRFDGIEPPRFGGQATLWIFAGVLPYVRTGVLAGDGPRSGSFVELGVMIKIPTKILY